MGRIHECLATLSILLVSLENGEIIYMKRFRFVSLELGFKNVLHNVCILRHPYIESLVTICYINGVLFRVLYL